MPPGRRWWSFRIQPTYSKSSRPSKKRTRKGSSQSACPRPKSVAQRVVWLAREGAEVVNLVFDRHGREIGAEAPRHMRDGLRDVHQALVKEGIRDQVTLMSSGGIGLPEHMAKAIICGADLVAIDLPLIIALECRLCGECGRGERCPVDLATIDEKYAVRRVVNLIGSWHSQLLEMLGAMGIREARRLRGEVGRCMFFEDLERAAFGRLFGKRKVTLDAPAPCSPFLTGEGEEGWPIRPG